MGAVTKEDLEQSVERNSRELEVFEHKLQKEIQLVKDEVSKNNEELNKSIKNEFENINLTLEEKFTNILKFTENLNQNNLEQIDNNFRDMKELGNTTIELNNKTHMRVEAVDQDLKEELQGLKEKYENKHKDLIESIRVGFEENASSHDSKFTNFLEVTEKSNTNSSEKIAAEFEKIEDNLNTVIAFNSTIPLILQELEKEMKREIESVSEEKFSAILQFGESLNQNNLEQIDNNFRDMKELGNTTIELNNKTHTRVETVEQNLQEELKGLKEKYENKNKDLKEGFHSIKKNIETEFRKLNDETLKDYQLRFDNIEESLKLNLVNNLLNQFEDTTYSHSKQ